MPLSFAQNKYLSTHYVWILWMNDSLNEILTKSGGTNICCRRICCCCSLAGLPVFIVIVFSFLCVFSHHRHETLNSTCMCVDSDCIWPNVRITGAQFLYIQTISFAASHAQFGFHLYSGGDVAHSASMRHYIQCIRYNMEWCIVHSTQPIYIRVPLCKNSGTELGISMLFI